MGLGIDLGTTFSAVSFCYQGKCEVIKNEFGNSITPSIIHYDAAGQTTVGEPAEQMEDGTRINLAKYFIGRTYEQAKSEAKHVNYKVVEGPKGQAAAEINGKKVEFPKISAEVLKTLAKNAKSYLNMRNLPEELLKKPMKFVITVPAYFNNPLRKSTKDAGYQAGLDVLQLLSEPVAASFYGLDGNSNTAAVIDIGGGTVDITVLVMEDGVYRTLSTTGDLHIGGHKFDMLIVNWLREKAKSANIEVDETTILKKAEAIKIELTHNQVVDTEFGPLSLAQFNKMMKEYKEKVFSLTKEAIDRAEKKVEDIETFFLVGGSSVMPIWKEMIKQKFGKEAVVSKDPDHSVALGASTLAAQLCNHGPADKVIIANLAFGYGVKSLQGSQEVTTFIVEPNVAVPAKYTKTFSTAQDFQTAVTVEILQGFDANISKNVHVGTVQYEGMPSKRAGQVEVDVEFAISEDQIMTARIMGKYPNAEIKEHVLTLNDNIDPKEVERRKAEAKVEADRFSFIIQVEGAMSEAKYAIESSLTKDAIEEPHKRFITDLLGQWEALKAKNTPAEEMKEEFEPKLKEAEPILKKIHEAKAKVLSEYDEKHGESKPSSETADSSSYAAPEDL